MGKRGHNLNEQLFPSNTVGFGNGCFNEATSDKRFGVLKAKLAPNHTAPLQPGGSVNPNGILGVHHVGVQQRMVVSRHHLDNVRGPVLPQHVVWLQASTNLALLPHRPVVQAGLNEQLFPSNTVGFGNGCFNEATSDQRFGVLKAKLAPNHTAPLQPGGSVNPNGILGVHHVGVQQRMVVSRHHLDNVRGPVLPQHVVWLQASTNLALLPHRPVVQAGVSTHHPPMVHVHEGARFRFDVLADKLLKRSLTHEADAHAFLLTGKRFQPDLGGQPFYLGLH
uniref:Uncharacterized protein n=1 Tax=Anopheles atroparvus TaxID=41427 RepID=A0A182ISN5_ANOAO